MMPSRVLMNAMLQQAGGGGCAVIGVQVVLHCQSWPQLVLSGHDSTAALLSSVALTCTGRWASAGRTAAPSWHHCGCCCSWDASMLIGSSHLLLAMRRVTLLLL
jgi:hypothetical protein